MQRFVGRYGAREEMTMVQRLKSNVPTGITAYRDPETGEIAGSYQPNKVMAQLTAEGVNRIGDTIAELRMEVARLRKDAKRLDFLDRNHRLKMGWYVGAAPAGNLMVVSVIQPSGETTSIRAAIDAAMREDEIEAAEFAEAERQIQTGGF